MVNKKANDLRNYAMNRFPSKAGQIALRFVNGNFRAQGFQGSSFKKWKPNKRGKTILVLTGKLRAATQITTQPGQITIKNPMKYAKVHNEGFKGEVSLKAHSRNKYKKSKVGRKTVTMKTGSGKIKGHKRKINLPQRQFIPTAESPSPVLNNAILREVSKDINLIMK
ncbi:hypothetical protein [Chryseobacterium sp.]|uniref:hypothetical protein n=1 Tax=Chryseobacterium sp. TaxID=1871047 RepID=UPI0028A1DD5A|nr:hypothetical protein [Chryseobacterium sp.]